MSDESTPQGYEGPNYTQVPNIFFDEQLRDMGEAELRVMLFAIRQTFGWHRSGPQAMSNKAIQTATGLSAQGVRNGIEDAIKHGYLTLAESKSGKAKKYQVNVVDPSTKLTPTPQLNGGVPLNEVEDIKERERNQEKKTTTSAPPADAGTRGAGADSDAKQGVAKANGHTPDNDVTIAKAVDSAAPAKPEDKWAWLNADPYGQLISKIFGRYGGAAADLYQWLNGRSKKKPWSSDPLPRAVTIEELRRFPEFFHTKSNDPERKLAIPCKADTLPSWMIRYITAIDAAKEAQS